MKRADIEVGKRYQANVRYRNLAIVDVREVGCTRQHSTRNDGVRVVTVQPFTNWNKVIPAGTEYVISTRDVVNEWTPEDQQRKDQRKTEDARNTRRADAIEAALVARGLAGFRVTPRGVTLNLPAAEALLGIEATP